MNFDTLKSWLRPPRIYHIFLGWMFLNFVVVQVVVYVRFPYYPLAMIVFGLGTVLLMLIIVG